MVSTNQGIEKLLNLSDKAIFSLSADGEILLANRAFLNLLSLDECGPLMPLSSLLHKYEVPRFKKFLKRAAGQTALSKENFLFTDGRGDKNNFIITLTPVANDSTENEGFAGKLETADVGISDENMPMALRELSEKYKTIYHLAFEGIIVHDHGIVLEVNPAFLRMSGYQREELIGTNIIDKCILPQYHALVFDRMKNDVAKPYEVQTKGKDGGIAYCETESRRIVLGDRELRITAIRDITQRKLTQQKLVESEERYKLLSSVTFEGIFIHDNGMILDANQSLANMLGYELHEIVGRNIVQLVVLPRYHQRVISAIKNEETRPYEVEVKRKDGSVFVAEVESGMVNYHGKWVRVTAARDIWQRKLAQKKLRENEEELNTFFRRSGDGFFIMQIDQPMSWERTKNAQKSIQNIARQMLISKVNHAMADQCGSTVQEMYHKTFSDLYAWDPQKAILLMQQLLEQGSIEFEMQEFHEGTSPHWIEGHYVMLYNEHGQVRGCCGVRREITDRKNAEESMKQQNADLKKANAELDNFVYMVSHDLKAPIASTKGLIHIARLEEDPDKVSYCLDLIAKSMDKLDSFILDILDYSRNSRIPVVPVEIDFEKLIDEVIANVQFMQMDRQVIFEKEIEKGPTFFCDRQRLQFIFNNIISNAIRFSDEKKPYSYLKIHISVDEKAARIRFADNGIGIAQEHRKLIFDMFYRANEKRVGSGLGLYIVKEAIDKLGGSIAVHSQVGEGTTFELVIPGLSAG